MYSEEDKFRLEVARDIAAASSGSDIIIIINDPKKGFDVNAHVYDYEWGQSLLDDARYFRRQDQEAEENHGKSD